MHQFDMHKLCRRLPIANYNIASTRCDHCWSCFISLSTENY